MFRILFLFALLLTQLFISCTDDSESAAPISTFKPLKINDSEYSIIVKLEKLKNLPGYRLSIDRSEKSFGVHIRDTVFRFEQGDINGDGRTDILLGIIKKTHFEPQPEKRLQIVQIDEGRFRPLWLGSKVCYSLYDFKPVFSKKTWKVVTLEKRPDSHYCIGFYKWQDFGLRLLFWKKTYTDFSSAQNDFNHE
jgi:hypothetical protein